MNVIGSFFSFEPAGLKFADSLHVQLQLLPRTCLLFPPAG
jgi:hypothetical protein